MNMHCLQFDMSVGGILTEVKQQLEYKQQRISFKVNYRKLQANLLDTRSCFVLVQLRGGVAGGVAGGGGRGVGETQRERQGERDLVGGHVYQDIKFQFFLSTSRECFQKRSTNKWKFPS